MNYTPPNEPPIAGSPVNSKPAESQSGLQSEAQTALAPKGPAQLSDNSSTKAMSDGAKMPAVALGKANAKRRKNKSNSISFRSDEDTIQRIYGRMAAIGCSESEAIRSLIAAGAGIPQVILSPRTPPVQLEVFMGDLRAWQRDFYAVRSRLNAPMPSNPKDTDLVEMVLKWREISERLLNEIPVLLETANSALNALTSLDSKRIALLRESYISLQNWLKGRVEKFAAAKTVEAKALDQRVIDTYSTIIDLIEDLGIAGSK